jgi:small subunit ribosomal protein S16
MTVRIRLTRKGGKKNAIYRIVVADNRYPRDGRFIEHLGLYNPNSSPPKVTLKKDRYDHWIKVGAQPTLVVKQLVHRHAPST